MNPSPIGFRGLYDRADRCTAHFARIARHDTIYGGARALVLVDRLKSMGGEDYGHVVADVYSASTGRHHGEHEAWCCPECGSVVLGLSAARACCANQD